jgi:hypothetical protein
VTDQEDLDQRLLRLSNATNAIHASRGFSSRVMLAVQAEAAPSWFESARFSARRVVPALAMAAALAVVWAVQVDGTVDDELAKSYAALELE